MNNEQIETLLNYQERMINGMIKTFSKLEELNGNIAALIDSINRHAAELDKRQQTTDRSLESIYIKELILCDLLAELKPEIMKIEKASDETAGHTLGLMNHAFRILQVLEAHTHINHCDLIKPVEGSETGSGGDHVRPGH